MNRNSLFKITAHYATGHGFAFNSESLKHWKGTSCSTEFAETHDADGCWVRAWKAELTISVLDQFDPELAAFEVGNRVFEMTNIEQWWNLVDHMGYELNCLNARSLSVGDVLTIENDEDEIITIGCSQTGFITLTKGE